MSEIFCCLNFPDIEKIIFVPTFKHPWNPIIASGKDRIAMLKLCMDEKMEVSDFEIKRQGVNYSIDTVRWFKDKTGADIYWIVGSDILPELTI